ncbi:MerR family transcriptional regulator [Propionibacteriaceae bacterium Y1923]|uniref:MerR family transcriptional regulator n=1 Tax=Aestuariimicrobium sp. Y1814 TaxID=3418742 RepID=UPI003C18A364
MTGPGHSIGEASRRSGLPIATLRAWEQRYRVVVPHRNGGGIRRYDDAQVARLVRMRELVEAGIPPRRAAGLLDEAPGSRNQDRPPLLDHEALLAARTDVPALEAVLDQFFTLAPVEPVIDQWLLPSMHRVGLAWQAGEIDVAEEHLISAAVMHRLAALFSTTRARGPRVVVGLPAGARHELPALALAVCLRRQGVEVVYLGADVPAASWQAVLQRYRPPAVVIGATVGRDVTPATRAAEACRAAGTPHVFVGGRAAGRVAGATVLAGSLSASALRIAQAVQPGVGRGGFDTALMSTPR